MVSLYFGLPRCGKTTFFAKTAFEESERITKGKSKYNHIYGNVHLRDISNYTYIKFDYIGKYQIENALVLIDEASIECDSRDYKNFGREKIEWFLLHGHYKCDIMLFTQQWDGIDKKIRVITDRVFYIYKGALLGKFFSRMYRIPYGIIIPDPKKDGSQKLGEIVQGYCKPSFLARLFSPWVYRSSYYKYFDSWEAPKLKPLPTSPSVQGVHATRSAERVSSASTPSVSDTP